ncbi:MAG: hypothetical protein M3Z23_13600 [Acidobacteriota bacterium]|nr:hypothetical protein [Acidobacteriota bacterium]
MSGVDTVITTNYEQGNNWRWQSEALVPVPDVHRSLATIVNGDRGSYYVLDFNAKKYIEPRRVEPILTVAMWLTRAPRIVPSGKTVHTNFETIETGESCQVFGHMARHVITRERTVAEPGACSGISKLEKDSWYIPYPHRGNVRYEAFLRVGGARECRDTVVVHGTQPELEFALQEKRTVTSAVPAGYPVKQLYEHARGRRVFGADA